jgi:hypothetical protein
MKIKIKRALLLLLIMLLTSAILAEHGPKASADLANSEQIAEGVLYVADYQAPGDPPVDCTPYDAAKSLYVQVLANLIDRSKYSAEKPLIISWVGLSADENGTECYVFKVSGYKNQFTVSYDGAAYEILSDKRVRSLGTIKILNGFED